MTTYMEQVAERYKVFRESQMAELIHYNQPGSHSGTLIELSRGTRFALSAWEQARLEVDFEIERQRDNVKLVCVQESEWTEADLFGGVDNLDSSLKPHIMKAERQHELERAERDGVWALIGKVNTPDGWRVAAYQGWLIGNDTELSDVRFEVMQDTIDFAKTLFPETV